MNSNSVIEWLLADDNPAVKYRTLTEILGESADKKPVVDWLNYVLPTDWPQQKGLWSTYYLTTCAESGLSHKDIPQIKDVEDIYVAENSFEYSCSDYMRLRALVRLGFAAEPGIAETIAKLVDGQLPDGGFLCVSRLNKLKYTPKSCAKANLLALMFCAECKKKGIQASIEGALLNYFWNHNLFYRRDNPNELILNGREGWRTIDTFHPFEPMRVGLHNIIESLCALDYGGDSRMQAAWDILKGKKGSDGRYVLNGTLSKSYLPKERIGKPSKWVTFYALLAEREKRNS